MTRYTGPTSIGASEYKGKFVRAEGIIVFGPNLLTRGEKEPEVYHAEIARDDGILNAVQDLRFTRPDDFDAGYLSYKADDREPISVYGISAGFRGQLTRDGRIRSARLLRELSPGLLVTARDKDGEEIKPSRRER